MNTSLTASCIRLLVVAALSLSSISIARADEFVGPLAGWDNVRNYGATGNGVTDDTHAIQRALDSFGVSGKPVVLYFPAGVYKITSTLTAANKTGVEILGADPAKVKFVWYGAQGGTMLDMDTLTSTRCGRFTLDGRGVAGTGLWAWVSGKYINGCNFDSDLEDVQFDNLSFGLRFCDHAGEVPGPDFVADYPVERCSFTNCSTAGISISNANTLDISAWYCLFDRCTVGIGDCIPRTSGHGNVQAYYSVFRYSSSCDASVSSDCYNSFRGNYSIGSAHFIDAPWSGNNDCNATIQDNTILDCTSTPITIQDNGPVMLIDNSIRYKSSPVVQVGTGGKLDDTVSVGNRYCVVNPISSSGRVTTLDDKTVDASSIKTLQPLLPATWPQRKRHVFELSSTATGADIQRAINLAFVHYNGQRAVVHIRYGVHPVSGTITVPAHSDLQLIGDGFTDATKLLWIGANSPDTQLLKIDGPSRATVRDIQIDCNGNCASGIVANVQDRPGDRVYMDQLSLYDSSTTYQSTWANLLLYGLATTFVDVRGLYLNIGGESNGIGVSVSGRGRPGTPWTGGRVELMPVNAGPTQKDVYDISNGAHLLVQDAWYEAHPDVLPRFVDLASSGSFTLEGALDAPSTQSPDSIPGTDIEGFQGDISILNTVNRHDTTGWPAAYDAKNPTYATIESSATSGCDFLAMGDVGDDGSSRDDGVWFFNKSVAVKYGFLNNQWFTNGTGSQQNVNSGRSDAKFLRRMLAQARLEKPSRWPLAATPLGCTDLRFYRVTVTNATSRLFVIYGDGSDYIAASKARSTVERRL